MLELDPEFASQLPGDWPFERFLALRGKVFRQVANRTTQRFSLNGIAYFIKIHRGCGWAEIIKNLVLLRLPVVSAKNEYAAIERVQSIGLETLTVAAIGVRGRNPAKRDSFIITRAIEPAISLEDLAQSWAVRPPQVTFKRALIRQVAAMTRTLHQNGVNHRDLYICHFLIELDQLELSPNTANPRLSIIDLHRTQLRTNTPQRWLVKDLAALFFSSMDIGLTGRDVLRFLAEYRQQPIRQILDEDQRLLRQVQRRAVGLYRKTFDKSPNLPDVCFNVN